MATANTLARPTISFGLGSFAAKQQAKQQAKADEEKANQQFYDAQPTIQGAPRSRISKDTAAGLIWNPDGVKNG